MNEIVLELNGWALLGIASVSAISSIAGWKFYHYKKMKNQIAQETIEREKLQIEQKNKEMFEQERFDNLVNLERAFYLVDKENIEFEDRDQAAVKLYRDIVSGKETSVYRSALDFNRFFKGMSLSGESLQSFTKAESIRKSLLCFSEYALVAALYFFKDSGYTAGAKGAPEKFEEAKRFMADQFGIRFETLNNDEFYQVIKVIAQTTVRADEELQDQEGLDEAAASQLKAQGGV